MIKFALCDDNTQLLSKLREMLESIFLKEDLDATVTFASDNPEQLLKFLDNNEVNVLFLDIDLNTKLTGVDIAKEIRERNKSVYIIFLTAHFEFIISALECTTFDFIQKPFNREKLEKTIHRLFDDMNANSAKFIRLNRSHELVNQNLVNYIQKDGMRTIYNMGSGNVSSYGSFTNISDTLPDNFVRCHKSFIVNVNNIRNVDLKNNTIFFKDSNDSMCFIGPKYKNHFMEVLNNYGNVE